LTWKNRIFSPGQNGPCWPDALTQSGFGIIKFAVVGKGPDNQSIKVNNVIGRSLASIAGYYFALNWFSHSQISNAYMYNVDIRPQLLPGGFAGNGNNLFAGFSSTNGSERCHPSRYQGEPQKNSLGYSNRELGLSKLRKSLGFGRHAFLRVQIGLCIIFGLIVADFLLGRVYLFLARNKKKVGQLLCPEWISDSGRILWLACWLDRLNTRR